MPAMNFRREFGAISGLSFVLVVVSSLIVGVVFAWLIPGLGLAWGIALGAIVSPTDAVATSIVKRAGAPSRVVTILERESLLNDATALVILRAAIAGTAVSVSLWGVVSSFAYSIAVAGIIGFVVGHLNLLVRARVEEASVNTAISFTVPFLAAIPAEELGASGLVTGRLMALLEQTATAVAEEHGVDLALASREGLERVEDQSDDQKIPTFAVISAQRKALLEARDNGNFSADALNAALAVLDADQISLELKGAPTNHG